MSFEFVPISEGLRRQELVVQLADRLRLLDISSQCLFDRIDASLQTVNAALEDITRRATRCGHKVEALAGEKKAVTIYSHPKFPIGKQQHLYTSFLSNGGPLEKEIHRRMNQDGGIKAEKMIEATHVPFDDDAQVKSLFFIHDRGQKKRIIADQLSEESIPWLQVSSLSSLILFNSSEVAYTLSGQSTTYAPSQRNRRKGGKDSEETEVKQLDQLDESSDEIQFNLAFQQSELPEILADLPFELPSLPGIADEFNFEDSLPANDNNFQFNGPMVLPDLAHLSIGNSKTTTTAPPPLLPPELLNLSLINSESLPGPSGLPPPPPPPPPLLPPPGSKTNLVPNAPPPPPPPPPAVVAPESNLSAADDSRASLLESIRAAGGRPRQKTVKERKHDQKLKKREEEEVGKSSEPLDMMGELRKRLESRRSGISSDKKIAAPVNKTTSSVPKFGHEALSSMSARIPAPSEQKDDNTSDSSDHEFNDEDWD